MIKSSQAIKVLMKPKIPPWLLVFWALLLAVLALAGRVWLDFQRQQAVAGEPLTIIAEQTDPATIRLLANRRVLVEASVPAAADPADPVRSGCAGRSRHNPRGGQRSAPLPKPIEHQGRIYREFVDFQPLGNDHGLSYCLTAQPDWKLYDDHDTAAGVAKVAVAAEIALWPAAPAGRLMLINPAGGPPAVTSLAYFAPDHGGRWVCGEPWNHGGFYDYPSVLGLDYGLDRPDLSQFYSVDERWRELAVEPISFDPSESRTEVVELPIPAGLPAGKPCHFFRVESQAGTKVYLMVYNRDIGSTPTEGANRP